MKRKFLNSFCSMLLIVLAAGNGYAQNKAMEAKIDSLFQEYNSNTAGVAVLVLKEGRVIFKKGYGMANLEYGIEITPQTVFHVASVSKQFTAFSVYLLEQQGKISFSDDIRKYIPEVPQFGKPITIKHLLYHTSGLRDQWALLTLAGWRMDDVFSTQQVLDMFSRQKQLNFEPGSRFSYSNTGYTLLAELVKRVSGQRLTEFARQHIFEPLKMNHTRFYDDHNQLVQNRAYSYEKEGTVIEKRNLNYSIVGATSLFTTAEDMGKWALNFEKPVVGDSTLIANFNAWATLDNEEPAVLAVVNGETIIHAKGQFYRKYRGLTLYNHTGGDAGYRAYLARFPDQQFSVILLSNEAGFDRLGKGLAIAEFYLGNKMTKAVTIPEAIAEQPAPEPLPGTLNDLTGRYYSEELATWYEIRLKESKLYLWHPRLGEMELTQVGGQRFSGRNSFPVELNFLFKNKQTIGFRISNFGVDNLVFEKTQ